VQAVARDVFAAAMVRLEDAGYQTVLHIHDELVSEMPIGAGSTEEFLRILTTRPDWADGMPIAAKVREGPRFCKIKAAGEPPPAEEPVKRGDSNSMNFHDDYQSGEREYGSDIATYIYRDKDGNPYLRVKRTSAKQFPQYHRENGQWKSGAPKGPRIPYRLPELLAAKPDEPIFICEGEKDADNVAALGLVAATNSGGAGKWTADLNNWFIGKKTIYLLEDNDAA
jgi:hypothetical protein